MLIDANAYELRQIFSDNFKFEIPRYQRPYSWKKEQASELFEDLYDFYIKNQNDADAKYFLGSIVIIKRDGNPNASVIDGQQRITTLNILLATLSIYTSTQMREGIRVILNSPENIAIGIQGAPRLIIRENDQDFFRQYIQNLNVNGLINQANIASEPKINIRDNAKEFVGKLDRLRNELGDRFENIINNFVTFIMQRCTLVVVKTDTEESAYKIFSVMNDRGLDLQVTDILKSTIIGEIRERNDETQENICAAKWDDLEENLNRKNFNNLFSHIRMIYAKKKAEQSQVDEFRRHVLTRTEFEDRSVFILNFLSSHAENYNILLKADFRMYEDNTLLNANLKWLSRVDFEDWVPCALQFMNKFNPAETTIEVYIRFFKALERATACLFITSKTINERIAFFSKVLNYFENEHLEVDYVINALNFSDEYKRDLMDTLQGDIYMLQPRKRNYVVLRLNSFIGDNIVDYNTANLTIEHILPQTPTGEWVTGEWQEQATRETWMHKIANLIPLNRYRNAAARNYSFDKKKEAYFGGQNNQNAFALTNFIREQGMWNPEVLRNRQVELMQVFKNNWEL